MIPPMGGSLAALFQQSLHGCVRGIVYVLFFVIVKSIFCFEVRNPEAKERRSRSNSAPLAHELQT